VWLAAAVFFWVAGSTRSTCRSEFDNRGLFDSGAIQRARALTIARAFHVLALVAMTGVGAAGALHGVYWIGLVVVAGVLVVEHRLVRADDLSKIDVAFLNANGLISMLYFGVVLAALALGKTSP
jgi:4-hydroxybenzoate polyprenyltransferase